MAAAEAEAFRVLPTYIRRLKIANPGSVADIGTETFGEGRVRFKNLFLSFGATYIGFRMIRDVIVLNKRKMGGQFKLVLLTACGEDANFKVYPLAFGIVLMENLDSWLWFLKKLEELIPDTTKLCIVSPLRGPVRQAKKMVYPLSHDWICLKHLSSYVDWRFGNTELGELVSAAGKAYTSWRFTELFQQINDLSKPCWEYLKNLGVKHWCRAHSEVVCYDMLSTTMDEQVGLDLCDFVGLDIIKLVEGILSMMCRWYNSRRTEANSHIGVLTLGVMRLLRLNQISCSCKIYDKLGFPCGHAIMGADRLGIPYETLVSEFFHTFAWKKSYRCFINPISPTSETHCNPITALEPPLLPLTCRYL
ncbi:hypothetical protein EUTSA_v10027116mg [Eutrema salsugineum]|uniref:SWIM-type domain-containing protein n=1 Tax=Eutrema salsugineum TaxID=72664 RepID=V4P911_EUTSA|nr:hypothetical protein EUTSA_v10027116mg [Eutrema salsugineum]